MYSLSRTRQQRDMCCFLEHARTRVGGDEKRKCESRRNPSCDDGMCTFHCRQRCKCLQRLEKEDREYKQRYGREEPKE